jgi:hypothetical protein
MKAVTYWQGNRNVTVAVEKVQDSAIFGSDLYLYEAMTPFKVDGETQGHEPTVQSEQHSIEAEEATSEYEKDIQTLADVVQEATNGRRTRAGDDAGGLELQGASSIVVGPLTSDTSVTLLDIQILIYVEPANVPFETQEILPLHTIEDENLFDLRNFESRRVSSDMKEKRLFADENSQESSESESGYSIRLTISFQ